MPVAPDHAATELLTIDLEHLSTSATVCAIRGEIDLASEAAFRAGLERALGGTPTLVIDLCEVTFIGSIAAAIVIDVLQHQSDRQVIKVVSGQCGTKVFRMVGLSAAVDCFPNRAPM
ncbi:STAS domain-containing protein [Pseudonocardia bannensis]|uniref:STAS domain-containing protein n=1 Tax=Pseudonocardia bannensis TaxID=630973 RepID=A0A848DNZ7_9PSEU|nr:STAS domain-containing protein [Pseudonocardia bannensis]NMH94186.1 STAS domain-containing protein [Pseudonocardia bannensis]